MTWQRELSRHPFWEALERLDSILSVPTSGVPLDTLDHQLRDLVTLYRSNTASNLDASITFVALDNALDATMALESHVRRYEGRLSDYQLFDAFANALSRLPIAARNRLTGLAQRAQSLEDRLGSIDNALFEQIREAKSSFDSEQKLVFRDFEERLRGERNTWLQEVEKLSENVAQLRNSADFSALDVQTKLDALSLIIENTQASVRSESSRSAKAVDDFSSRSKAEFERQATEWGHFVEQASLARDSHTAQLELYKSKAESILTNAAFDKTASTYAVYADEQKLSANRWRKLAVAIFLLAFIWFALSSLDVEFLKLRTSNNDLLGLLVKWGGTAALVTGAIFAARESGAHRRQERDAKQVELSLNALYPFTATMTSESQETIHAEAARAIFILDRKMQQTGKPSVSQDPNLPYEKILATVLDAAKNGSST